MPGAKSPRFPLSSKMSGLSVLMKCELGAGTSCSGDTLSAGTALSGDAPPVVPALSGDECVLSTV